MRFLAVFIYVLLFLSCATSTKMSNKNIAEIYKNESNYLTPDYFVYHLNDSLSELHFKIATDEFQKTLAKVFGLKFELFIYESYESVKPIDTISAFIRDSVPKDLAEIIGKIKFKLKYGSNYLVQINLTNNNNNKQTTHFIEVKKIDYTSKENFLIVYEDTKTPIFNGYLLEDKPIIIQHQNINELRFTGRYYNRNYSLPPPPFSVSIEKPFEFKEDSLFFVKLNSNTPLKLNNKGFYFLSLDKESTKNGVTLFCFQEQFPKKTQAEAIVEPLRYITNKREYAELSESTNARQKFEQFWLNSSSDPQKAKELIKNYYNRVTFANTHFTTYNEGWKTDRGMVYLIFGPPNSVFRSKTKESWIYGEENNYTSLHFVFHKTFHPFSDNDYVLQRSSIYKTYWYRAVDAWRQGRVSY
jgi:GWxTD domain-containing protein